MVTEENEKFFDIFSNAIIKIENTKTGKIFSNCKFEFKLEKNLITNNDNGKSLHLYVNDEYLQKYRDYKVTYKCTCGRINTICLSKYFCKLEQNKLVCQHCLQDKRYNNFIANPYGWDGKRDHPEEYVHNPKRIKRIYNFDKESDKFKNWYKSKPNILTESEFYNIINDAYGIEINEEIIILTDDIIKNIEFIYAYPSTNRLKYVQKIKYKNKYYPIRFYFKCTLCDEIFAPHLDNIKNGVIDLKNPICRHCKFNNKRFSLVKYEPLDILYQSGLELSFLVFCEKYNIAVKRGPNIKYNWNNAKHTYKVDFYLPEYGYIIELKENHKYHRDQVKSGKWDAKQNAAIEYANQNNLNYKLLFTKDVEQFFNCLKK